jgi:hypothetical protein
LFPHKHCGRTGKKRLQYYYYQLRTDKPFFYEKNYSAMMQYYYYQLRTDKPFFYEKNYSAMNYIKSLM